MTIFDFIDILQVPYPAVVDERLANECRIDANQTDEVNYQGIVNKFLKKIFGN